MGDEGDFESEPYLLHMAVRGLCGVLGTIGLAAGGAAVYLTSSGVAAGVLMVIGLFFTLIAISGTLPKSIAIGDNKMELAGRYIKRSLVRSQPESKLNWLQN